jgi:Arc/MetJ-type ribon-helix-helix transcriptional regulator
MTKSNNVLHKKHGRGRPATGHDPTTTIRLSDEIKAKIDAWAERQEDKPPRSEAIRRLVELGLTVERPRKPKT